MNNTKEGLPYNAINNLLRDNNLPAQQLKFEPTKDANRIIFRAPEVSKGCLLKKGNTSVQVNLQNGEFDLIIRDFPSIDDLWGQQVWH